MKFIIFSSLPEIFNSWLNTSLVKRSVTENKIQIDVINIRKYGIGNYKRIDDYPFGGGDGMILKPDVVEKCIEDNINFNNFTDKDAIFITSPRGEMFDQKIARNFCDLENIYIFTNRFEGVDQRAIEYYNMKEISIGNYVLMGGELPSMIIAESVIRLIPNVVKGSKEESFSIELDGKLEYDQFTRPEKWKNLSVPDELISGNHQMIKNWKSKNLK